MNSRSPEGAKQQGMAIISALLIAAVVAVIAAGMLTRQSVATRALEADQQRVQGVGCCWAGWRSADNCFGMRVSAIR